MHAPLTWFPVVMRTGTSSRKRTRFDSWNIYMCKIEIHFLESNKLHIRIITIMKCDWWEWLMIIIDMSKLYDVIDIFLRIATISVSHKFMNCITLSVRSNNYMRPLVIVSTLLFNFFFKCFHGLCWFNYDRFLWQNLKNI